MHMYPVFSQFRNLLTRRHKRNLSLFQRHSAEVDIIQIGVSDTVIITPVQIADSGILHHHVRADHIHRDRIISGDNAVRIAGMIKTGTAGDTFHADPSVYNRKIRLPNPGDVNDALLNRVHPVNFPAVQHGHQAEAVFNRAGYTDGIMVFQDRKCNKDVCFHNLFRKPHNVQHHRVGKRVFSPFILLKVHQLCAVLFTHGIPAMGLKITSHRAALAGVFADHDMPGFTFLLNQFYQFLHEIDVSNAAGNGFLGGCQVRFDKNTLTGFDKMRNTSQRVQCAFYILFQQTVSCSDINIAGFSDF